MSRLAGVWNDITEGHSIGALWQDFQREARSSFEASAPRVSPKGVEVQGLRRVLFFARAMLFSLTPARRVLFLLGFVLLLSVNSDTGQEAKSDATGRLFVAAGCLLVVLFLEVADRVAMKRDLEVARDIQNWLVPQSPPNLPGLDIAFATRPANTVAGDYYDVIPLPNDGEGDSVLFVVADVAGKGIPSGLLMACFRTCLRTLAGTHRDLCDLMLRLNRSCFADSKGGRHFTTVFLGEYSRPRNSLTYINAGQNPPLLRDPSGSIIQLEVGGMPCGTFSDLQYDVGCVPARPGDLLVIYTDGVVEAVNDAGEEFGLDRLRQFVTEARGSAAEIRHRLFASIETFAGKTPQHDDITCMVVQINDGLLRAAVTVD